MKALNKLRTGEEGVVCNNELCAERLRDIGLVRGTRVRCLMRSPLGDPAAYLIRGALIAIRDEDASWVEVESGE